MGARSRFVAVFVAAVGCLPAAGQAPGQNVVIKMATLVPQGSAWHTTLLEMVQQWQTLSGGRVTVRLYPGGVAGDDGDVVRKMRLGTLDAGVLSAAGLADIDRSVFAVDVPMGFRSYEELDYVLGKMTPQLEKTYEDKGFIVLAWADAGWVHFFTKAPVKTPDDLKALKIFTWAGDTPAVEMWKAAGFNPVPLPATEISTALQTGLVTALPTTPQAAILLQWYTHARYMTDVKWAVLVGGIVMSRAAWDKVPADLRPPFLKAARDAAQKLQDETRQAAVGDMEAMAKRGLTVVHVDAATEELWRTVAEAAYPRVRGGFVPAAAFDEAMKYREEYRKGQARSAAH